MDTFEYAMVLVSIVIGLSVTHLLAGLGQAINRLRDRDRPITIEPTYLLWMGFVFWYLVGFWWWEYKFFDDEWKRINQVTGKQTAVTKTLGQTIAGQAVDVDGGADRLLPVHAL